MTRYFFDTNFLFKTLFNRSLDESELNDYLNDNCEKFISKNVVYEFSNIFLEFINQFNYLLIDSYYKTDEIKGDLTCDDTFYNNHVFRSLIVFKLFLNIF